MNHRLPPTPWYRQFWPWFIIALPFTAVVASFATLIIAAHDPDGLVADDYYKEGLAINQELGREHQAAALGLTGLVRIDTIKHRLTLTLEGSAGATQAADIELRMIHPTRPNLDRTLRLTREADNRWSAALDNAAPGRWHVRLESAQGGWRVTGRLTLPEQQQAVLRPQAG